jgi:hypothetical protein
MLAAPRPTLPLPLGSTGVLWSSGAHLSQFAILPEPDPAMSFFFGDAALKAYGFRSTLPIHMGSTLERSIPGNPFTPLTDSLNRGVPGEYVNDAAFPYLPSKGGAVAVYPQNGADNLQGAQELSACMEQTSRTGSLNGTYTFSTPKRGSPAFDRAFGRGASADQSFQPPEIVNCLNRANDLTRQALQGRDLVIGGNGGGVNVSTATNVGTGEPVPGMLPSAAANMRPYLEQFRTNPGAQGLTSTPITGAMWLRGVTGVLRVGGFVLLVINLDRIYTRYDLASEYDKPLVAGEEATMLTAGLLGSLVGEVIGETVVCAGLGPGFGLCMLAAAAVGGTAAGVLAEDTAHGIGSTLQDAAELNRKGQLLPGIMDAATKVLGTAQDQKVLNDFKRTERSQPSNGMWDLFNF